MSRILYLQTTKELSAIENFDSEPKPTHIIELLFSSPDTSSNRNQLSCSFSQIHTNPLSVSTETSCQDVHQFTPTFFRWIEIVSSFEKLDKTPFTHPHSSAQNIHSIIATATTNSPLEENTIQETRSCKICTSFSHNWKAEGSL